MNQGWLNEVAQREKTPTTKPVDPWNSYCKRREMTLIPGGCLLFSTDVP